MTITSDRGADLSSPVGGQDVSVVICGYTMERWPDIIRAVESVRNQRLAVREIIVVIDHNEALLAACRSRWPELTVVPNEKARGLSGGRDTGLAHSSGAVVAFLDDDAAARPDWCAELVRTYNTETDVLGVGGLIEPSWDSRRPSWWPSEYDWVVGCSYRGLPTGRADVASVIGANMSFRRSVLIELGAFSAQIGRVGATPTAGEETEMYLRAKRFFPGGRVIFEPRVAVDHRVGARRATWLYFRRRCFGEGLSKARIGRLATHDAALETARGYVLKTLPIGFVRGLFSRDPRRGLAIAAGLAWTSAGYVRVRFGKT